jgi:pyruvate dehydrogenase E2 component (dihydrolipoamide acetyltransferase)
VQKGDALMAEELFIPKLGQTVEEVTLITWLLEDGAKVTYGQPVLEVETDKATFPIEANANGTLHRGPFAEGEKLPVLTVVALIGKPEDVFRPAAGGSAPAGQSEESTAQPQGETASPVSSAAAEAGAAVPQQVFASPRARKLAREKRVELERVTPTGNAGQRVVEKDVQAFLSQLPKATPVATNMAVHLGVELAGLAGSGARGAVTKADVARAAQALVPAVPPMTVPAQGEVTKRVPLTGVRGIIFARMGESVHTTARVTLVTEVDATRLVKVREQLKERVSAEWGFTPGYNDLLGLIVARALREHPNMNARVSADGTAVEWLAGVHLGLAVDTERGLLVPVVRDADRKGLRQFGAEFRELVERARAGRSLPDDLAGGTFTITNLGMYDVDAFTPVINLPEAAILGVGRIQGKVVPHKGKVKVRQMLTLSLVFDHRLNDGAPAARFLQAIKGMVEEPALLIA